MLRYGEEKPKQNSRPQPGECESNVLRRLVKPLFRRISLLEIFDADSGKISDEMRELLREILAFVSNSFYHNIHDLLGHAVSQ